MKNIQGNVGEMEAQLVRWAGVVRVLSARADEVDEREREGFRKQVDDLNAQRAAVRERFEVYKEAGVETWEAFRLGMVVAWNDVEVALVKLRREHRSSRQQHTKGHNNSGIAE